MDILISIKPEYVHKIESGIKTFELRKRIPKINCKRYFIYSSSPEKCIVGYFYSKNILYGEPNILWKKIKNSAGIEKKLYDNYFKNKKIAYAIEISEFIKLKMKIDPKSIIKNFNPPQSFCYIDGKLFL